jgi:hypothetical protein
MDYARGHGGVQRRPPIFITPWCHNREGKVAGPYKHNKGHSKLMFTCLPDSSHIVPTTTTWDTVTVSQIGPTIAEGL